MIKNPFNLTFGKQPKYFIPRPEETMQIIEDFTDDEPSTQLYLITGPRGSGKTVLMSAVSNKIKEDKDWIVIPLSPYSDLQKSFITQLYQSAGSLSHSIKSKLKLSYDKIGVEMESQSAPSEINADLLEVLTDLQRRNKKVLVKIDEVNNSTEVIRFMSSFSMFIQENLPVFLIATGLQENIESLQNTKSLTFLYRARKITLTPLNLAGIARVYKNEFNLRPDQAAEMAKLTKGYSYAFQVLGYFTYENRGNYMSSLSRCQEYLNDYVYEKIWPELSEKDKQIVIATVKSKSNMTKDIREYLDMQPNEFSPYKARLIKKGLVDGEQRGKIVFSLPFFENFVADKILYFD